MNSDPIIQYQAITLNFDGIKEILFPIAAFFGLTSETVSNPDILMATLFHWWTVFSIISLVFCAVMLYAIVYTKIKYGELHHKFVHDLEAAEAEYARLTGSKRHDGKWGEILSHSESDNPNDWRLAIIEADIQLEEVLEHAGYHGTTIGEKLKGANRQSLTSLDDAWAAHKVRNEIAHQGSDFILTKRMTNETVMRYKRVFDEIGGGDGHGSRGGHH